MNILSTLTEAITGKPPEAPDQRIYSWLRDLHPEAAASQAELVEKDAAQKKWLHGFHGSSTFTEQGANIRYAEQFKDGKNHTDVSVRTRGLESLISENAGKQLACRAEMAEASTEAAKVVNAIQQRLAPAAEKVLAAREAAEKAEAQKFGLVPVPSALTTALRQFVNALRVTHVGSPGSKPSDMAPWLNN